MKTLIRILITVSVSLQWTLLFAQQVQWEKRYPGKSQSSDAGASTIAVDNSGNCYVSGYDGDNQIATVMYDVSGNLKWVSAYGGKYGEDLSYSTAVDKSGTFVYVAGATLNQGNNLDYVTIKYDAHNNGKILWARTYNGPGDGNDAARHIEVDANGNVYVTGESFDGYSENYTTIKYNSKGVQQWAAVYDNGFTDIGYSLKVSSNGKVFVIGSSDGVYSDIATVCYNDDGTQAWTSRYNGSYNGNDFGTDIAVLDDAVYVTGTSTEGYHDLRCTIIKYNAIGVQLWVANNLGGVGNSIGIFRKQVGTRPSNGFTADVFVAGHNGDYGQTVCYNDDGVQQWAAQYPDMYSYFQSLAIDKSENIYVAGFQSIDGGDDCEYTTVKYSFTGNQEWAANYNNGYDGRASGIGVYNDNVYVTGRSHNTGTGYRDYLTIQYVPNSITNAAENNLKTAIPRDYSLGQNYPNPFNPATKISYNLPAGSRISVKVFDITGQLVSILCDGYQSMGNHEVEFNANGLASGIYFYKLVVNGATPSQESFSETKKMILTK